MHLTISANILILNEVNNVNLLIKNLIDAQVDEIIFLDGGSTDGTWELIKQHASNNHRILLLSWPQRLGTEYKRGFNEVARRNLMLEASSSKYILYIDADERISPDFKSLIDIKSDCVVVERTHFWNGKVRVNSIFDRVWSPERQVRIFRRRTQFKFSSKDPNLLHNNLTYKGVGILLGDKKGKLVQAVLRLIMKLINIKIQYQSNIRIFHYHYFDLNSKKVNDLRSNEFTWPELISDPKIIGSQHEVIYVSDSSMDDMANAITKKYYVNALL